MKTKSDRLSLIRVFRAAALAMAAAVAPMTNAQILWTGSNINFTQPPGGDTAVFDQITPGVALDRALNQILYNEVTESGPNDAVSPADTLWAFGTVSTISQATNLSYQTFGSLRNGDLALVILNKPMVLQLISEKIYIPIEFSGWGQHFTGGFSYTRATAPATAPTPSVSITNPASGTVFAAPANLKLMANATVSSGTVTNVSFFTNASPLGSVSAAPFNLTASNLAAGVYQLTAVATAAGVSATSAVVSVAVVTPVAVTLSSPQVSNGVFSFNYTANPGLTYVVQDSANFTTWLPLATNVALSSSVQFTNALVPNSLRFYQVGRLPNP